MSAWKAGGVGEGGVERNRENSQSPTYIPDDAEQNVERGRRTEYIMWEDLREHWENNELCISGAKGNQKYSHRKKSDWLMIPLNQNEWKEIPTCVVLIPF